MADRGISWTGNGGDDVSDKMPKACPTASLSNGGPVSGGPDTNTGASADAPVNSADSLDTPPSGSGTIQFVGDI